MTSNKTVDIKKDEYGNTLSYTKKTGMLSFLAHGGDKAKNIGKVVLHEGQIVYAKHEKESDRLIKHNAWTILYHMLNRSDRVMYETDKANYSIHAGKALSLGFKLQSPERFNKGLGMKWVVPIEHWTVEPKLDNPKHPIYQHMHPSWAALLKREFDEEYFEELRDFVSNARSTGQVYPSIEDTFKAFKVTSYDDVRVVILGQDPYHDGSAMGLAFSILETQKKLPPSLRNILQEVNEDVFPGQLPISTVPDLTRWAKQGVLLLNTILTVNAGEPLSHADKGWERFTMQVIHHLAKRSNVVYMLWGAQAHKYEPYILPDINLILKAPHPSPLSVYRGFSGCKHFSTANEYLRKNNRSQILW